MSQQTITINGTIYDALTGLPIKQTPTVATATPSRPAAHSQAHHSHEIHQRTQKSHTLNRRIVKNSAPATTTKRPIQKSPMVTKFAAHPAGAVATKRTRLMNDIGPVAHPMVKRAQERMHTPKAAKPAVHRKPVVPAAPVVSAPQPAAAPKPSAIIKQEAISEALHKAPSHNARPVKAKKQKTTRKKSSRLLGLASATLALFLLGGYFTYLNMPSLSVRVAAAQAGIDASYPSYRPDGYSLSGPVAYNDGQVSLKFASNAGPQNFTITQARTNWDSTAVQENYVKPNWGNDYIPYAEHGLTIYAHDGEAVWVNGGIRYTIEGDAPLSASQIRNIATGL